MKTAIQITFLIITILFFLGSLGEKTDKWKANYLLGAITMAVLTILTTRFL